MTTTARDWIAGARPRTLSTAVAPVLVGTASAIAVGGGRLPLAAMALGVAVFLQVAVNYANDYSDGVRGTDADRIGPDRLVATGKARPGAVKIAAVVAFAIAAGLGLWLAASAQMWWIVAVGAVAIVAAWTYTGTSRPYGYAGWGEVSVFAFFGPVATLGTMVTQARHVTWWAVVASAGVGLFAVALLLVNNIRDRDRDELAGKRTLAVLVGEPRARRMFMAAVTLPVLLAVVVAFARPWALLVLLLTLPAILTGVSVRAGLRGRSLKVVFLAVTALSLAYGLVLALGIALGGA